MKPAAWLNSDHKESPDEKASIGCGRGGRAALLAAALQSRRPGHVSMEGFRPSPPAGSAEAGASNSPSLQSASSGSLEGATPMSSGGRGFAAGRAAPVEMVMKAAGVMAPGGRGMLTALGRSILHTPAGREVLAQLKPQPGHQQPGHQQPGQYSPPQPAQHMEPQQRPSAPQLRHAVGPAQGAVARHERSSQPPVGRMADMSIKQYRGKTSKPVPLEVNYVRLGTRRGMGVFEYHTDFEPVIDCKRTRFELLATDPVVEAIGHTRMFDGSKLYLPHQLREKAMSISTVLPSGGSAVMVHIQFVKQAPLSQCTHLYNVLFKKIMHCLQLTQIGHNYFDRKGAIMVPQHKLEMWPGYVQSVSEYDGGLLLNCDASFRVLRTMTAREVLFDVYNAYPREYKAKAAHAIVGSIVMTQYNYRTYRVDDIDWKQTPTCTFQFHTGEQITYKDYYKRIYNLDIQDWDQPLLVHRDKPRKGTLEAEGPRLVHLVPELCTLTGLTDTMRSDFRVMKDIAGHTRVNASERQQSLLQYVRNVHECEPAQRVLDDWGVTLDDAAIHLDGRVLPEEKVMVQAKTHYHNGTADWGRLLLQDSLFTPVHLENGVVVYFKRDTMRTKDFTLVMSKACPSMGIQVRLPPAARAGQRPHRQLPSRTSSASGSRSL